MGFLQYRDPEANSSDTEPQHSAHYPQPSTWTGMEDLDKEGISSITGGNESSEISEEHVVIHLRPGESTQGWGEENQETQGQSKTGDPQNPSSSPNTSTLGLSVLESLEAHGGSAQEEVEGEGDEEWRFGSSDSPLSSQAAPVLQAQTANYVLHSFVNNLMKPFRYWTGSVEADTEAPLPATPASLPEGTGAVVDQAPPGSAKVNPTEVRPKLGSKGSTDNGIMEHRSGGPSLKTSTGGLTSSEEGLTEQEKEVVPFGPVILYTQPGRKDPSTSLTNPSASSSNGKSHLQSIHQRGCVGCLSTRCLFKM